jgi:dihydrofolate reductase
MLAIIAALSRNRVIGKDNQLPWRLPADLKHFKAVTLGKPVIMGRKTFESIGKPLPGRANIVVSRDPHFHADGIAVAHSLDDALAQAHAAPEIMLIGGAQLYAQALPRAQRLYLTLIDTDIEGDAHFPDYDPSDWRETAREDHAADVNNPYPYSFVVLERD